MAVDQRILALIEAQTARRMEVEDSLIGRIVSALRAVLWGDPVSEAEFLQAAAESAEAGMQAVGDMTVQSVTEIVNIVREAPDAPATAGAAEPDPFELPDRMAAGSLAVRWIEPVGAYHDAVDDDLDEDTALTRAESSARGIIVTDLSDAHAEAVAWTADQLGTGEQFRRIIHPEKSRSGQTCGLCVVASTRIYSRGDLRPVHDGCHCEVVPIVDGQDPGGAINLDDLGDVYADAGDTTDGWDLKRVRYTVDDNGKLQPDPATLRKPDPDKPQDEDPRHRSTPRSPRAPKSDVWDDLDWIENQIRVIEPLRDSEWRTAILAKLKARRAELTAS